MRVALVSPSFGSGGAAKAAARLADALAAEAGCEVLRFAGGYEAGCENFNVPGDLSAALNSGLRAAGAWTQSWRARLQARDLRSLVPRLARQRVQAIHLHGFNQWDLIEFPLDLLADLAAVAPAVWTLHDAWPLNGRLDYPPVPASPAGVWQAAELDQTLTDLLARPAPGWAARRVRLQSARRCALVAPSAWLAGHARRGLPGALRCEAIANCVPFTIFRPVAPALARAVLGWDPERPVILMAAVDWQAPRKGGALWLDAAARIRTPYDLALVGEVRSPGELRGPGTVHALGRVGDDRLLALAYAAADLVVVPSLFDNLPNVLLESLACGTPCVGFATGGIPEAIVPGRTGGLAEAISGPALAACVEHWLGVVRADRAGWSARCVEFARAHYDPGRQARRHRDLYEELARDTQ